MPSMTAQEKKWQARDDAHTLARAEEVKSDPKRFKEAKKEATVMLKEEQVRLDGLKRIAGGGSVESETKRSQQVPKTVG